MNKTSSILLAAALLLVRIAAAQADAPSAAAGATDASAAVQPAGSNGAVSLYHGEVQVLDLKSVARIAVGNGNVLKATLADPGQVVLIGEAAGTSTLRVWLRNGAQYSYEVTVRQDDTARILRDVQDLLVNEPGLSAKQVDGHVLIEGDYSSAATAARIAAIMKIYPQVVSAAPQRDPAPSVALDRMVHMDVRVVEIRKTALEQLGVDWSPQANGPNLTANAATSHNIPRAVNGGLFGIATNITSVLDLLAQNGDSWTLAEPKVSCKSGGQAKFVVGGEIPIPVSAGLGTSTIIYKNYGVILEFKPVADDKGNISSSIVAEVSEPDPTYSNNGLVAFRENRTETEVTLKENETLVISGLLRNNGSFARNGVPGAQDVPVLGALFRSKNFQNERTELVVLVTPRSVSAQSEASLAGVRQADQLTAGVNKILTQQIAE